MGKRKYVSINQQFKIMERYKTISKREGLSRASMTQLMQLTLIPLEICTRIFLDPFGGWIPSIRELVQT